MGEKTDKQKKDGTPVNRIIVKGYLRPDGTSYYVAIPKEIRDALGLAGGEHFAVKAKKEEGKTKISLKLLEFSDEQDE